MCPGVLEAEASGTAIQFRHRTGAGNGLDRQDRSGRTFGRTSGRSASTSWTCASTVVAGSVALGYGEPFFTAAQAEIDRICRLDHSRGARIEPAGCGDEGPLIGAAAVGLRSLGRVVGIIQPN